MKKHHQVVAAVINYEGRILCMQRPQGKSDYTSFHWEFPGGKIEPGETPQQALHRELLEEMEYDVRVGGHVCTVEHEYPDFIITMQAFWCVALTKEFVRKEHVDHKWLLPEELDTLDWCAADVPIKEKVKEVFASDYDPDECFERLIDYFSSHTELNAVEFMLEDCDKGLYEPDGAPGYYANLSSEMACAELRAEDSALREWLIWECYDHIDYMTGSEAKEYLKKRYNL